MNTIQVIGNSKRQVTADFRSRRKLPNSRVLRIRSTHVFFYYRMNEIRLSTSHYAVFFSQRFCKFLKVCLKLFD